MGSLKLKNILIFIVNMGNACCNTDPKSYQIKPDKKQPKNRNSTIKFYSSKILGDNTPHIKKEENKDDFSNYNNQTGIVDLRALTFGGNEDMGPIVSIEKIAMEQEIATTDNTSIRSVENLIRAQFQDLEVNRKLAYEKTIEDTQIDTFFDKVIEENYLYDRLEGATTICCDKYDSENEYGYKVEATEFIENKKWHLEMKHYFSLDAKQFDAIEYLLFSHQVDETDRLIIDNFLNRFQLVYYLEKNNVMYFWHKQMTDKGLNMPKKDMYTIHAIKKLTNGDYMEVSTDFDNPFCDLKDSNDDFLDRMYMPISATIIKSPEVSWNSLGVNNDVDNLGRKGAKVIKYQYLTLSTKMNIKSMKTAMSKNYNIYYKELLKLLDIYKHNNHDDWAKRVYSKFSSNSSNLE